MPALRPSPLHAAICRAIDDRRLLRLTYHGASRVVEPHLYGRHTGADHDLLRAFQLRGASASSPSFGWKLFRTDEIERVEVLDRHFWKPRADYTPDDPLMDDVYCKL